MPRLTYGLIAVLLALLGGNAAQGAPFGVPNVFLAHGTTSVREIDPTDGSSPQTLTVTSGSFSTSSESRGGGVAFDENLNLYVTVDDFSGSGTNSGIIVFDSQGSIKNSFEISGTTTIDFRGLAVREGVIYVATSDGVRRYNATTGNPVTGILGNGLGFRDVAFDSAGNLYGLRGTKINKWTAGSFSGSGTETTMTNLVDGRALDFDGSGNLYITDSKTGSTERAILKYSSALVYQSSISTGLTTNSLIGLAFDPINNVFYASHTKTDVNQILKFAPSDTSTTSVAGTSGLSNARYLAVSTPEASTFLLFGVGLALLGLWRFCRCERGNGQVKREDSR